MKTEKHDAIILSNSDEKAVLKQFVEQLKSAPLPDDELLPNLGLFLTSKNLSRILFFYEIYKKIIHTHGIVVEFGVRWGQTLSIMSALRGVFEPFNRHRKIVGFDTFEGFRGMSEKDGELCKCKDGSFSVAHGYEDYLGKVLYMQEQLNPMSHLKRYEIVKGDIRETLPEYFKKHPETIISLAVLDFDIYAPTKVALEAIKPYLCKGSILVFDELCDDIFPGETIALKEVLGLNNVRIQRLPMTSRVSYLKIE
ncbi:MAG: crotonobetainyl-CoA--carnitine CoA-transferase [Candidatus Schekmanbacteria bacterium RIFCSPHIGHO2_02_FULL_38_11]|uniref:Crotonobetainyl-CoA--carnitine CoA-transferase n=1 Tax=Candidatus Schekmanbacteria bacterium RIFCSPLOWO2_12_FULL_38_15 TaxID=1817883 RepID=A0A1F7SJH2_9BACT|nr:MAG: crotonobetainyl-CoA--carnitine CoA-transferase [Candidatus Schekmanbacteria bacterium GWA2_38_9]OGL50464.1 MAG: crotonobetainyl-CoA--carnitine CoA-transferase [Candidatus Schekmanbacteria bacterium RIFCSPLOWO2_02_FULL_38_14]OGL53923.1 MAG: crotonobetainyl-CoA--carnitine CoA-transferase [Candidatus Schekmanbacteria bacterium RIFCSPLOWO2_12_FULL_38_15]OGL54104.1 MAG: crotonobetainyl-CoA--carnitine CoA-transferase [Candidatus Schekmanbacteria bacterium RIFCSPHIGHO2_02_FULL_38_11]